MSSPEEDLTKAVNKAVELASKLDPSSATLEDERELARAMIRVRRHIRTRGGGPDWTGTTGLARSCAAEIYSAVNAPADELARFKNRMRQRFREIVPALMHKEDVASLIEHAEDLMDPANFFNDLGVYVRAQGRAAQNGVEASQLIFGAAALINLVDRKVIADEGPAACAIVDVQLQDVVDQIQDLQARIRG